MPSALGTVPKVWQFPSLRHLSLDITIEEANVPFFHNLLSKYSRQLYSVRCPSMFLISLSAPELSLPILQALATDVIDLSLRTPLFQNRACPIKHLVHSWDTAKVDALRSESLSRRKTDLVGEYLEQQITGEKAKKIEKTLYDRFTKLLRLFPQLEAIFIPNDFYKPHCEKNQQRFDEAILKSFARLKYFCDSRGVQILDLYGYPYPLVLVVSIITSSGYFPFILLYHHTNQSVAY
jgi:hypothetical protein